MEFAVAALKGKDYVLTGARRFDLAATLECGQCFRWEKIGDNTYHGIVAGRCRTISQDGGTVIFHGVSEEEFNGVWRDYFDLGRDYDALRELFCRYEPLRRAVSYAPGLRVLRQEPWEALCSFILSQNNNIPRIKGLVARLCESFGEPIPGGYAFPDPERLASLTPDELAPVRCGFRAKYVIDAAKKVLSGEVELKAVSLMPPEEGAAALQRICGVGPKVAMCALLYGCAKTGCVPVDVWMKRALAAWFPDGLPEDILPVAGLAQQYLFHYARLAGESAFQK